MHTVLVMNPHTVLCTRSLDIYSQHIKGGFHQHLTFHCLISSHLYTFRTTTTTLPKGLAKSIQGEDITNVETWLGTPVCTGPKNRASHIKQKEVSKAASASCGGFLFRSNS